MRLSGMDICNIAGQILMKRMWLLFPCVRYGIIGIENNVDNSCAYHAGPSSFETWTSEQAFPMALEYIINFRGTSC